MKAILRLPEGWRGRLRDASVAIGAGLAMLLLVFAINMYRGAVARNDEQIGQITRLKNDLTNATTEMAKLTGQIEEMDRQIDDRDHRIANLQDTIDQMQLAIIRASGSKADPSQVLLEEWYPQSWKRAGRLILNSSARLETRVDELQWFNPCVRAPETASLSNVSINVVLPIEFEFQAQPKKAWVYQDGDNATRRYTTFVGNVNPGYCINGHEQIAFISKKRGPFTIQYGISAREIPPIWRWFDVRATP